MSIENVLSNCIDWAWNVCPPLYLEPFGPFQDAFSNTVIVLRAFIEEVVGMIVQYMVNTKPVVHWAYHLWSFVPQTASYFVAVGGWAVIGIEIGGWTIQLGRITRIWRAYFGLFLTSMPMVRRSAVHWAANVGFPFVLFVRRRRGVCRVWKARRWYSSEMVCLAAVSCISALIRSSILVATHYYAMELPVLPWISGATGAIKELVEKWFVETLSAACQNWSMESCAWQESRQWRLCTVGPVWHVKIYYELQSRLLGMHSPGSIAGCSQRIQLQGLKLPWQPSSPSYELSEQQSFLPFCCYSGRNCKIADSVQELLQFLFPPSSAISCSCIVITAIGVHCIQGRLAPSGAIVLGWLGILEWRHQGQAKECWMVIRGHREIKGACNFWPCLTCTIVGIGAQYDIMSSSFARVGKGRNQKWPSR